MPARQLYSIFKKGSRTYFYNTLFFPRDIKDDVFALYSFVRKADDLVDTIPQRPRDLQLFKRDLQRALKGDPSGDLVADSFAELHGRKVFDGAWTGAFFRSMEMDLGTSEYETWEELERYVYGSAEVIGLYMAAIMDLPPQARHHARHLGKAMQLINFIRDLDEDIALGRRYLPGELMREHGLDSLDSREAFSKPDRFREFIGRCLGVYLDWQRQAEEGYRFIPRKYLVPIINASEMYKWTAKVISRDPFVVFDRKVKPSIPRIVFGIGLSSLFRSRAPASMEASLGMEAVYEASGAQ